MFKTLRSRLLLSYFAVITVVLLVVALALLAFAAFSGVRFVPVLQQLAVISAANRNELLRWREAGSDVNALARLLEQTAADQQVRILVANANTRQVIYDSGGNESWLGVAISNVDRPARFLTVDRNTIAGRFQHPNGSNWLVYAQLIPGFSNFIVFYARQEPTALSFFSDFFFRPLLVAGILAFFLAILLAVGITRSVARPLQEMAGAAEAVAQGDFEQQLALQGPEEVQRVASSFNSMTTQVKQSQQVLRDFVANVSHDLKTPITAITGWSQALLDGTADSPTEQQRAAGIIYDEAGRMARMVNQLLDLARLESGQLQLARQPVDLGHLLTEVYRALALRAEMGSIHLTLDTAPTPPVIGDADRLMQALTNLVDNALTHTPAGGRVQLAVRPDGETAVALTVQDTGKGIPPEELPRIFERFYQVDKARTRSGDHSGSGLGLAIARELIEAHHGRIQVTSQVGLGTAFVVYLPVETVIGSRREV